MDQIKGTDIAWSVLFTQLFFLIISFILSIILFPSLSHWRALFQWNFQEILMIGLIVTAGVIFFNFMLWLIFGSQSLDDGGLNKKLFTEINIPTIISLCMLISFTEELLFRGVLQTNFGLWFASIVFALLHIRYLSKPILLLGVVSISFFLGYVFMVTENLWVTIFAHFCIDLILGVWIHIRK
ncbi:putative protease [Bacillus sp. TS-2]|nr:putative protease [Bacillus sp. TS-2]